MRPASAQLPFLRRIVGAIAILLLGGGWPANGATPPDVAAGRRVYDSACAACHGRDGRGAPVERVAFALPLPDFTDCEFAVREANHDWSATVHDGGPARAFNRMMPAFGSALSSDDIERALDYMRTFCTSSAWPRGELNLPRPLVAEKAFPEDEAVAETDVAADRLGGSSYAFTYERRLGARTQWELKLPIEVQPRDGQATRAGAGDVAGAIKHALYHSVERGTIFSVIGEVVVPTGSESRGFGSGTPVVESAIAFGQILPANAFVQFHGGIALPADTEKAAREAFWRTVVGRTFTAGRFGRAWSPMIEAIAARELVSGEKVQWDLVPEMQVTLSTRHHIRVAGGVQIPVTDAGPRSTRILAYILWDWFDGGLFNGW
jgi:mono/diheme cytochrome c family protein